MFQQALREADPGDVAAPDVRLGLAECLDDLGRRDEAFGEYMQVVLERPDRFTDLRPRLQPLLDSTVAASQKSWVTGDWAAAVAKAQADRAAKAAVELFHIQILLLAAEYEVALQRFHQASLSSEECAPEAPPLLETIAHVLQAGGVLDSMAPVYELRGEISLLAGDQVQAADAFYDAGRRHGSNNDFYRAMGILERAAQLRPELQPVYWYWAEFARLHAQSVDAGERVVALQGAMDVWQRGRAQGPIGPEASWAYVVRALILDGLATISSDPAGSYWEMTVNLEQTLLLDSASSDGLAFLGRAHRMLKNMAVAADVTTQAMSVDPANNTVLLERSGVLTDLGDEHAIETLDRYREVTGAVYSWAELQEGYVLSLHGRHRDAVQFLERALAADPGDPSPRGLLARAYVLLGQEAMASTQFQSLYDSSDAAIDAQIENRAWAAYQLGRIDEARKLYLSLLDKPNHSQFDVNMNLSSCALVEGDIAEANRRFVQCLDYVHTPRQAKDADLDFATIEQSTLLPPNGEDVRRAVKQHRTILHGCRRRLERRLGSPTAAADELHALVERSGENPGSMLWLSSRLGLARISAAALEWEAVVDLYDVVHRQVEKDERYPEVRDALIRALRSLSIKQKFAGDVSSVTGCQDRLLALQATGRDEASLEIAETLQVAGRRPEAIAQCAEIRRSLSGRPEASDLLARLATLMINLGQPEEAVEVCTRESALAEGSSDPNRRARFEAIHGLACARLRDLRGTSEHFSNSLRVLAAADYASPSLAISVEMLAVSNPGPDELAIVSEALALIEDQLSPELEVKVALSEMRGENNLRSWQASAKMAGQVLEDGMFPAVFSMPITLEAHAAFFPLGGDTPEVKRMIETDIPSIQDRIRNSTGVRLPAIQIVTNESIAAGAYQIRIRGDLVARGNAIVGGAYCLDRQTLESAGVRGLEARDPTNTAHLGAWLRSDQVADASLSRVVVLDPYEFMLRHVEGVVSRRLSTFVGMDGIHAAISEWQTRQDDPALWSSGDAILSDEHKSLCLLRVVKALVDESVSVFDLGPILHAFENAYTVGGDLIGIVEDVRRGVRMSLPGADGVPLIGLSQAFEAHLEGFIQPTGNTRCLVLPANVAAAMRDAIVSQIKGQPREAALVVAKDRLRPFVRLLVRHALPRLSVLAQSEIADPTAAPTSRVELRDAVAVGAVP